jgi:hypothetical protein
MRLKLSTLNALISTDETNGTDGTDTGASNNPTLSAHCCRSGRSKANVRYQPKLAVQFNFGVSSLFQKRMQNLPHCYADPSLY